MSMFPDNLPKAENLTEYVSWKCLEPKKWVCIDADGVVLGRLASHIANILRGKTSSKYTPHIMHGCGVIVVNSKKVSVTGRKEKEKKYYRYSGYRGGLKVTILRDVRNGKSPEDIIFHAVKGMLGQSKMAKRLLKRNLRVYPDSHHDHIAQNPEVIPFASFNVKNSVK